MLLNTLWNPHVTEHWNPHITEHIVESTCMSLNTLWNPHVTLTQLDGDLFVVGDTLGF